MSNTQASPEGWTTKSHSHQIADAGDYDGCYEITNGKLSLFTKDDGDDVEEALSGICKAINDTEINFYVDNSDKFVLFATEQENKRLWALMVKHGVNPYEGTDLEKHWLSTPPQEGEAKAIAEEKILCAATWYKDLPLVKKFEDNCRPYNCDRGIVFCGWRHANCLYSKCSLTGLRDAESGEFVQGFLTSKNRFVDRKEAYSIAFKNNQIIGPNKGHETNEIGLTSEDLY